MHYDKFGERYTAEQRAKYRKKLIDAFCRTKQYEEVFSFVDTMTETEITDTNAEHIIAECYKENNEYDKYFEYAERYLANPKSTDNLKRKLRQLLVINSSKRNQFDKVIEYSQRLDKNQLKSYNIEYMLGYSYHLTGDVEKAVKYYIHHIVTMNGDLNEPTVGKALYYLGEIHYKDFNDIERAYRYWGYLDKSINRETLKIVKDPD